MYDVHCTYINARTLYNYFTVIRNRCVYVFGRNFGILVSKNTLILIILGNDFVDDIGDDFVNDMIDDIGVDISVLDVVNINIIYVF